MTGISTQNVDDKHIMHLISALIAADEKKSGIGKRAEKAATDIKEATKTGCRIKQESATQQALEELFKGNPLLNQEKINSIQNGLLSVLDKGNNLDLQSLLKAEIEHLGANSKGGIACAKLLEDDGTGQSRLEGFTQDMLAKQMLVNEQLEPALEACKTPQEYRAFLEKINGDKKANENTGTKISSNQFKNMLAAETLLLELVQKLTSLNATAENNSMSYEGVMGDIIKQNAVDKANTEQKKIDKQHHESTCQKVEHALEVIVGVALLIVSILAEQPELAVAGVMLVLEGTGAMNAMVEGLAKLTGSKVLAELIIAVVVLACTAGIGAAADVEMTAAMIARTVFMVLSSTGFLTDGISSILQACGVPKDEADEIAGYVVLAITVVTILYQVGTAVNAAGGVAKAAAAVGKGIKNFFSNMSTRLAAFFTTAAKAPETEIELEDLSRLRTQQTEGNSQDNVERNGEGSEGEGSGDIDTSSPRNFAEEEQDLSLTERTLGEEVEGKKLEEGREDIKGKKGGKLAKLREMIKGSKKLQYLQKGAMGLALGGIAGQGVCQIEIGEIQIELAALVKEIAAMDAANIFAHMNLEMAENNSEGYKNEDKTNQKTTVDSARALQRSFATYQQTIGVITA